MELKIAFENYLLAVILPVLCNELVPGRRNALVDIRPTECLFACPVNYH